MSILILDANILIDLLKASLIEELFQLGFKVVIPDIAFEEVEDPNTDRLFRHMNEGKLIIWHFAPEEISRIENMSSSNPALSFEDCSCLFVCLELNGILISGDQALINIVRKNKVIGHGLIWLLKEMVLLSIIDSEMAAQKLEEIMLFNPRLPREVCYEHIKKWRASRED